MPSFPPPAVGHKCETFIKKSKELTGGKDVGIILSANGILPEETEEVCNRTEQITPTVAKRQTTTDRLEHAFSTDYPH